MKSGCTYYLAYTLVVGEPTRSQIERTAFVSIAQWRFLVVLIISRTNLSSKSTTSVGGQSNVSYVHCDKNILNKQCLKCYFKKAALAFLSRTKENRLLLLLACINFSDSTATQFRLSVSLEFYFFFMATIEFCHLKTKDTFSHVTSWKVCCLAE